MCGGIIQDKDIEEISLTKRTIQQQMLGVRNSAEESTARIAQMFTTTGMTTLISNAVEGMNGRDKKKRSFDFIFSLGWYMAL